MFSNVQSRYSEEEERCSLKRQFFAFNKHPVLGRDSCNHQQLSTRYARQLLLRELLSIAI